MWDNPRTLNLAAGFLVGVATLAFAAVAVYALLHSRLFPVRELVIGSPLKETTRGEIDSALRGHVAGNFFAVELAEVRGALERLPWVRRVEVRRVWPDRLEVSLEEHIALARWNDDALVNTHGERFQARTDAPLPRFVAPAGAEREVTLRYARFTGLLAPLGTGLERIVLTARFAWQLELANGLHVMLGRDADAAEERLRRFVGVYQMTLGKLRGNHEYVDLRYPNGFALRAPDLTG